MEERRRAERRTVKEEKSAHLRHKVGRVHPGTLGVQSADLPLVVVDKLDGLGLEVAQSGWLGEGGHAEVHVGRLGRVEAGKVDRVGVVDDGGEERVHIEGGAGVGGGGGLGRGVRGALVRLLLGCSGRVLAFFLADLEGSLGYLRISKRDRWAISRFINTCL